MIHNILKKNNFPRNILKGIFIVYNVNKSYLEDIMEFKDYFSSLFLLYYFVYYVIIILKWNIREI